MDEMQALVRKQKQYFYFTYVLLLVCEVFSLLLLGSSVVLVALYGDWLSIILIVTSVSLGFLTFFIKPAAFLAMNALAAANLALAVYYVTYDVVYVIFADQLALAPLLLQMSQSAVSVLHFLAVLAISQLLRLTQRVVFPNQPDFNHPIPLLRCSAQSSSKTDERFIVVGSLVGTLSSDKFDIIENQQQIELGERDRRKAARATPVDGVGQEAESS